VKQEHQPYSDHTFQSGADSDTEKELLGAQNTGNYVDMQNGQVTGPGGQANGVRLLRGETVVYPDNLPTPSYKSMWEGQVLTYHVEIWADTAGLTDPLIRVNGVIVLQSALFPVTVSTPLQVDDSDNSEGGEITLTNKAFPPMSLNVKDMVDSLTADPNRYFSAFTPELYQVNLADQPDIMAYIEHVNLGGGGGLPVGNYQYGMRKVTAAGDRTNISVLTPMIPVMENMSSASDQFPYSKTFARQASTAKTRYGVRLRFRVTNLYGYEFVEIVRVAWNQGAGIGFNPTPVIVARVAITPNQISVQDYIDPGDQNVDPPVSVSAEEINRQTNYVAGAKAVRYYDRRLVLENLVLQSRISELTFDQLAGSEMHPVIENIGTAGYGDPWNFVYRRHYLHGERYGYAINCIDGSGGQFYAQKIPNGTNFEFPNRRDIISATTALYSYGGTVKAATVSGTVDQTHEVFDLTEAVAKSDTCSFKNIYRREDTGLFGWKQKADVIEDCDEDEGAIENHGAVVDAANKVYPYYAPYSPVDENDPDTTGHNYVTNTQVSKASHLVPANNADYRPPGFGPTYYSQGALLSGVDNFPEGAKAFTVVRTDAAGRVQAQGLAMYLMEPAEFNALSNAKLTTKPTRRFWFYAPDIESGIVSSDVLNDIITNPLDYQVQFVSPLGFFSEMYSFEKNSVNPDRNRIIDMISYARMIRDVTGGDINPMEDVNMGIDGADGNRYVAYGRWRNTGQQPGTFAAQANGNGIFNLVSVERVTEGRGTYLAFEVDQDIYGRPNVGGVTDREFEDQGLKDWTEPLYMVNIVRTGAAPKDADITDYKVCHYQKLESIIGRGNGQLNQSYPLVDERWEDCIPALDSAHPTAATDRYLYIKKTNGAVERWLNVTFVSAAQLAIIINAINTLGNYLGSVGVYTHTNTSDRFFTIDFNVGGFSPAVDDLVMVRYDKSAPIRFWGGDGTIGEAIFAPIDRQADAYDDASNTQFALGMGFPYRTFKLNPRHYVIARTTGVNRIQDEPWSRLGYLRQLCMMFTVESRGVLSYAFNQSYPSQFFPLIGYVMRPNRWDPTKSPADQNIYPQYVTDYGDQEITQWKWGGFRFLQNINPEYSNEPQKRYFSAPEFGFQEELDQPYMVAWSMPRVSNVQNVPGVRTFPSNNIMILDDKAGEIKYAWSGISEKGDNAYAFTDSGICMLLANKAILSDLDGGEIAYMATEAFFKAAYWITRYVGMSDEFYRTAAECSMPVVVGENQAQARMDALFFMNNDSVFQFSNNQPKDIGRALYYTKLREAIDQVSPGFVTNMAGVVESKYQQYWVMLDPPGGEEVNNKMFMFNIRTQRWVGYNLYRFDRFAMNGQVMYATRESETYVLDSGFTMDGVPVEWRIDFACSPVPAEQKEYIRFFCNSARDEKPTRVEFYDKDGTLLAFIDPSLGPLYLKWYGRWEQFVPRKSAGNRYRLQERVTICRIIYDTPSDFTLVMAGLQYKLLK
jgi:hypothetical protein